MGISLCDSLSLHRIAVFEFGIAGKHKAAAVVTGLELQRFPFLLNPAPKFFSLLVGMLTDGFGALRTTKPECHVPRFLCIGVLDFFVE